MNKELEEIKQWLKDNIKYYQEQIKFIEATDCDYYDEEYELYKKRAKIFKSLLNYIENSISKEVIKEAIKEISRYKECARQQIQEKIVVADSDSLNFGREQAHGKDIEELKMLLEGK